MINVTCDLKTYNDISLDIIKSQPCKIVSHHSNDKFVRIFFTDSSYIVVSASDLKAAIDNCTNTVRYL